MRRCAFLTLDDPSGFVIDDPLAYEPLRALGWEVEALPWRQQRASWQSFDAVVIRTPWDYHLDADAFVAVLEGIERSGVPLENRLDLVRWNLHKSYLRELAAAGVPTVPTLWRAGLAPGDAARLFDELACDEMVIKPVVGANASDAFRVRRDELCTRAAEIEATFAGRPLMAQPFVQAVVAEGEYSLIYFNGALSHAILKTPKRDDFRVQEEHGGTITRVEADDALRRAGAAALAAVGAAPLQARADLVRSNDGAAFWLMELELIEPSLYLRMDSGAPERFARAIDARMGGRD